MGDRKTVQPAYGIIKITPELKVAFNDAKDKLKASDRRQFMAQIVKSFCPGGQRHAQRELGWKLDKAELLKLVEEYYNLMSPKPSPKPKFDPHFARPG